MNTLLDMIMQVLEVPFSRPWIAPFIILPLIFGWAIYLSIDGYHRTRPFWKAMDKRLVVLRQALGDKDRRDETQSAFSEHYDDIQSAMDSDENNGKSLQLAWREFHETLVDETQTPIINTSRPNAFFMKVAPSQLRLMFWSNLCVGIGLILTFLGLIVALYTAQKGMTDNDPAMMQQSLIELLRVAGAKFFSSVAGVGASLLLRRIEYQITRKSKKKLEELCSLLERGLLYMPPQKVAIEQLSVLKEQRDQLKTFNTDVAFQLSERIGVQFQQAIQPVAASLDMLNSSISDMGKGLGDRAIDAINDTSGGELRALSQTLSVLGEKLNALSESVGSSGDDAARQIRAAGEDFAGAARDIRDAFDRLTANVDGLGGKLTEQSEAAAKAQSDSMAIALKDMEAMQAKSSETMLEAVKALQSAGTEAALTMQKQVGDAMATGVSESQHLFRTAMEESGEGLRSVSAGLTKAVGDAADKIDAASQGFVKSGEGAAQTAEAMSGIVLQSRTVASALDDSARTFVTAAAPLSQAVQAINEASGKIARAVEAGSKSEREALDAMRDLVKEVAATHEAAAVAWQDYRARFEGVDKALEGTVLKLGDTLGDTFASFREFSQKLESEMASAVGKLSNTLAPMEDYAESLDKYVEENRKSRVEAAE